MSNGGMAFTEETLWKEFGLSAVRYQFAVKFGQLMVES